MKVQILINNRIVDTVEIVGEEQISESRERVVDALEKIYQKDGGIYNLQIKQIN